MYNTDYRSPNKGPRSQPVRLLLIHATVGGLQGSLDWLCNPKSKVSAHYVVSKLGRVFQLVNDDEVAWHAGRSSWRGEADVNGISIGIELENLTGKVGFVGQDPYPQPQINAALDLCRDLMTRHALGPADLARHADVAIPKGRKTDPAGFPWSAFLTSLASPAPVDVFAAWGPVGKPTGVATGWAIPQMWLKHPQLGACVRAEEYLTPAVSVAVFAHGFIWYNVAKNAAFVEMF